MNTTIWIIQFLLAAAFLASGLVILIFKRKLRSRLTWLNDYSPEMVIFICLLKIVGAIGILVPLLTGLMPYLSVLAAIGFAVLMIFAFAYHFRHREFKDLPATILLFALAMIVAYCKSLEITIL